MSLEAIVAQKSLGLLNIGMCLFCCKQLACRGMVNILVILWECDGGVVVHFERIQTLRHQHILSRNSSSILIHKSSHQPNTLCTRMIFLAC